MEGPRVQDREREKKKKKEKNDGGDSPGAVPPFSPAGGSCGLSHPKISNFEFCIGNTK
jgi:hypothetical protein